MSSIKILAAASGIAMMLTGAANATSIITVYPTSAAASSVYPSYGASFAIDNSAITDWAAGSTGAGSYINLSFDHAYALQTAFVTDRVTSGGGNNGFIGGLFDFTTQYTLQAYTSSSFTTTLGSAVTVTVSDPLVHTAPSDFLTTAAFGQYAQYVRYTVNATNGVNPGLSDIHFSAAVPEISTWVMMLAGFGLAGMVGYRRKVVALRA
jgi:hypothetical protein